MSQAEAAHLHGVRSVNRSTPWLYGTPKPGPKQNYDLFSKTWVEDADGKARHIAGGISISNYPLGLWDKEGGYEILDQTRQVWNMLEIQGVPPETSSRVASAKIKDLSLDWSWFL